MAARLQKRLLTNMTKQQRKICFALEDNRFPWPQGKLVALKRSGPLL